MPELRVIGAEEVARKEFATSFRGFDQHEVRAYLGHLGTELAALRARERSLEERLAAAESKALPRELGHEELEAALGHEMAKVLQAAREAATEIRTRAEEQVARLLREASDESSHLRREAAALVAEGSAEAERAAAALRDEAGRGAEATRAAAAASVAGELEAARELGRQMVGEAQAVRERILRDLGRRRRLGQQHLEQLRAGRDRLLEACRSVQGALDVATAELVVSEPEARAAAETAGLRAAGETELTLGELEAEVVAAVDAGLVVATPGPAGVADDERPSDTPPAPAPARASVDVDPPSGVSARSEAERGAAPTPDLDVSPETSSAGPGGDRRAGPSKPPAAGGAADHDARGPGPGLRRRKRKTGTATVRVADPGHQSEGVRLLPPEVAPVEAPQPAAGAAAGTPATSLDAGLAEQHDVGAAADPATRPEASTAALPGADLRVTSPDGAGAAPGSAPAARTSPASQVGPEVATVADSAAGTAVPPGAHVGPGVAAAADPPVAAAQPPEGAAGIPLAEGEDEVAPKTDDLFSRLRADRAAKVGRANEVLAHHGEERSTDGGAIAGGDALEVTPDVSPEGGAGAVAAAFDRRDGEVEPHERTLTRALKRALADEQNQLLDELRRAKGVPGTDVLLPEAEEHSGRYARVAVAALAAAASSGGLALPGAEVEAMAGALGRDLVAGLRPRLARAIEDGAGDEGAATEVVSAAYREWKTSRIEPLARHHVLSAWAAGSFASTSETELRWVVDPEVGCSPDCADNALAGPTTKGVAFPTGQPHPPAHPGCRCLAVPTSR